MFKTLQNKDEIEDSTKAENNSLNKVDKKIEKEMKEKEKPIHPKLIFEKLKTKKKLNPKNFRKPTPEKDGVKKMGVVIDDY